ncbi:hypothetical protein [Halalkalibacter alkalisediminis]|uniref:Amidohydrolase-related domain-containing protein n=1 Tax=Halalkalibacter alkalisediminis TaxID=935616 RepID=A0ABV6NHH2_9BACI|nr:hypothetical protein [Halalkalibacter alkalisediminis]
MYLLDKAMKIDEEVNTLRSYLIKDGQIQYVTTTFDKWNKSRVSMKGILMTNGRITFDDQILGCESFHEFQTRQKELIKNGFTTVAVAPLVEYERQIEAEFKRAKHALASSTLDYVVGLTIPVCLLRTSALRLCQNLRIPFLRITLKSFNDIKKLPWTHLSQTLLTYPIVLVPEIETSSTKLKSVLLKEWELHCANFQIHTAPSLQPLKNWSKPLLQKVGLFPQKGILLNGSDADYLLFHEESSKSHYSVDQKVARVDQNVYHEKEPVIVIVKGEIVKSNDTFSLRPGFGRLVEVVRPGRFMSLSEASSTDQLHQQSSGG